jgi:hypothetical protein
MGGSQLVAHGLEVETRVDAFDLSFLIEHLAASTSAPMSGRIAGEDIATSRSAVYADGAPGKLAVG